jgi:ABC-2 type transport system permease protein
MPTWLQWIASLNPLTYAIEPIRHLYIQPAWSLNDVVLIAPFGEVSLLGCLGVLAGFSAVLLVLIQPALRRCLS